jgi:triosephosphate isomerase
MSQTKKMIIGGNWKSNGTISSVNNLVNAILNKAEFNEDELEVVIAPIDLHISTVKKSLNSKI